jgi:SAM-dependent methyltransferase
MPGITYLDLLAKYGVDSAHPGGLPMTKKILSELAVDNDTKLLDLGCGTGQTLSFIAKNLPCKITGVDINDKMLHKAAIRFKDQNYAIELVRADVQQLPFPSGTFDIALSESVTVFTHISKALREYNRVLKAGGILIAIEITARPSLGTREAGEICSIYNIEEVPTCSQWECKLLQAGFSDVESYEIKAIPTLKFTSLRMRYEFAPFLKLLKHYNSKLSFRIYKCKK